MREFFTFVTYCEVTHMAYSVTLWKELRTIVRIYVFYALKCVNNLVIILLCV